MRHGHRAIVVAAAVLLIGLAWFGTGRQPPEVAVKQSQPEQSEQVKEYPLLQPEEQIWQFGEAETGSEIVKQISFQNEGGKDLEIQRIRTNSSHLIVRASSVRIPPHGTGVLEFTLSLNGLKGPQNLYAEIESSDSENPVRRFPVTGEVYSRLTIAPEPLRLVANRRGEEISGDVDLELSRGLTLSIRSTKTSDSWIKAEVLPAIENHLTVRVRAILPASLEHHQGWLHLLTDQDNPYRTIPIRVTIASGPPSNPLAKTGPRNLIIGEEFHLSGQTLEEVPFNVASFKGKPILVWVWASWNPEVPALSMALVRLHDMYKDQGLRIVGVNLDRLRALAKRAMTKNPMPWTTVCYPDLAGDPPDETPPAPSLERPDKNYRLGKLPKILLLNEKCELVSIPKLGDVEEEVRSFMSSIQQR